MGLRLLPFTNPFLPVLVVLMAGLLAGAAPSAAMQADDERSVADYERAEQMLNWNLQEHLYRMNVSPQWVGEDAFWYRIRTREGTQFYYVDPEQGLREEMFDHEQLAETLGAAVGETLEPFQLPLQAVEIDAERTAIEFNMTDQRWRCYLEDYTCDDPVDLPEEIPDSIVSPDGTREAYIEDYNLWVHDRETGETIQLTEDGKERYGYAIDSQGWRRSDMPILIWSPDSRRIKTYRLDERNVPTMVLWRMQEGRPEIDEWPYAVPGDPDDVVPRHERVILDVEERTATWLDVEPDHQRISNCCGLTRGQRWGEGEVWGDNEWRADGNAIAFVSTSRDYRTVRLRLADAETGDVREVYEETVDTFFESNLLSRGIPNWRVLHDTGEFIWYTRAEEGWGHLYLHDLETGERINQITTGDWNVLDVLHVDEDAREILFSAVGKEEGRDPYLAHLYRVNFDGSGLELLSPEDANHSLDASPSGRYIVDNYSSVHEPPRSVVRDRRGEVVLELEEADVEDLYATGWTAPEPFTVKARDGETDIYGLLYRPSDFDADQQYPIINAIYPGPQVGSVGTRSFSVNRRHHAQALAELGFVVVQIDALGTPLRSKEFHTAWYGDMSDNGLEDQKVAMEQLAEQYEWIDLDRVGMVGHSGGGYATATALFRYPDFFHVGVSSAGNHDNRGYTYYWGEKYHGQLEDENNGDSFMPQAIHHDAKNLEGKLLISYGTMDTNVHPNMTLLVIDELIRHNKDFDILVMPNRGHGYSNETYNIRRTWDYFVRHLLGQEPPHEYEIERN